MKFAAFVVVAVIALVAVTGCIGDDSAAKDEALYQELEAARYAAANHVTSDVIAAQQQAAADAAKPFVVKDVSMTTIHYGWSQVTAKLVSHQSVKHDVAVYVDFYDANGVKVDHVLDLVSVDAKGTSVIDATSTKVGAVSCKVSIDRVY